MAIPDCLHSGPGGSLVLKQRLISSAQKHLWCKFQGMVWVQPRRTVLPLQPEDPASTFTVTARHVRHIWPPTSWSYLFCSGHSFIASLASPFPSLQLEFADSKANKCQWFKSMQVRFSVISTQSIQNHCLSLCPNLLTPGSSWEYGTCSCG